MPGRDSGLQGRVSFQAVEVLGSSRTRAGSKLSFEQVEQVLMCQRVTSVCAVAFRKSACLRAS